MYEIGNKGQLLDKCSLEARVRCFVVSSLIKSNSRFGISEKQIWKEYRIDAMSWAMSRNMKIKLSNVLFKIES